MQFRKWTSGLVAAALLASVTGTALADTNTNVPGAVYSDSQAVGVNKPVSKIQEDLQKAGIEDLAADHWAAGSVSVLIEAGLIAPDAQGHINVDAPVSGSEGVAIFAKVLGIASKTDDAATAMAKAKEAGLIGNNISADRDMTRVEIAMLLAKALGVEARPVYMPSDYPFADFEAATAEERGILAALYQMGIFKGYPDKGFHPDDVLTKAQIAILIDRILGAQ